MSKDEISIHILRKVVVDGLLIFTLVIAIIATDHLWNPFQRGFFCGDETLMYPYKEDTVDVYMLKIGGIAIPLLAFLICEWTLLRKEQCEERCLGVPIHPWMRGFYCALASFFLGLCFVELATNISKSTIGRLRPHFFDICQPSVDCSAPQWQNRYILPHEYTCTGEFTSRFRNMRMSFVSGHSSWATYTMTYLALYLEKRMIWNGTRVVRHTLQFGALMLCWFTVLSRISDNRHHWSDVLAGLSLGLVGAVVMWAWGTDLIQPKKNHKHTVVQYDITNTNLHQETLAV
ncbi:putative phosphatidate phosphatase [Ostrinia furnacalis]|uniref:putative phosphatidate phosphatase n=1 Tax=Ostrinia furnacalis TaxID=93504 RepID=UPI001040D583|nr:putative phosphatidate phosphatase [Ostrinia furnacalis]